MLGRQKKEKLDRQAKDRLLKAVQNIHFYLKGDQCDLESKKDMNLFTF